MTAVKPVIAITAPLKKQGLSFLMASLMIRRYGGIARKVTVLDDYKSIAFDGLLVLGGTDIFPDYYGGQIKEEYIYDHDRDKMEIALLNRAEKAEKPILGICRGAQLMNVHRNGSLHFDIKLAYEKAEYPSSLLANIFYRKRMYIKQENSLIHDLLNCKSCRVNSMHTQAVDTLGDGLTITGAEQNGIVQSIEDTSRPFYLGVQFHPEYMIYQARFRRIFKKLVFCAKNM